MHSWVFRHRTRLRVLYGPAPSDVRVGPVPIAAARRDSGRVERQENEVVLHPFGPR